MSSLIGGVGKYFWKSEKKSGKVGNISGKVEKISGKVETSSFESHHCIHGATPSRHKWIDALCKFKIGCFIFIFIFIA